MTRTCTPARCHRASRWEDRRRSNRIPRWTKIRVRLKPAVAKAPKGGWIDGEIGGRVLDDESFSTRSTLDAIAPDHPVMLTAWTGHSRPFNTAALRRLQVRDDEPDPAGGFFVRTAGTRIVTGLVHEYARLPRRAAPDAAAGCGGTGEGAGGLCARRGGVRHHQRQVMAPVRRSPSSRGWRSPGTCRSGCAHRLSARRRGGLEPAGERDGHRFRPGRCRARNGSWTAHRLTAYVAAPAIQRRMPTRAAAISEPRSSPS